MTSLSSRTFSALALLGTLTLGVSGPAHAQFGGGDVPSADRLVRVSAPAVTIAAGEKATVVVTLTIESGWHINANPPSPDYMIPTTIEAKGGRGVTTAAPVYPAPHVMKVGFDDNPLSVYDHSARIELPVAAAKTAENGAHVLKGTLRFQSCNDQVCLAPASVPFEIAVTVTGGVAPGAAPPPTSTPRASESPRAPPETGVAAPTPNVDSRGTGFTQGPPAGGAARVHNPISEALARGGWAAFLTLFLIGLALNLTPCVYPMLGVTVSIFGARRAAPPLQVFGLAAVYVLGICTMYSVLGLAAALTGGLFGSALQSPIVSIGIGALLVALSLSMFGLYEFSVPPELMTKLGGSGTTNLAGIFASGLVVGVFAAPCTGPPIVALLAVVGEKGDPWFGFQSFFTLSLGLGAPYLILGTFSNLLQRMPRSGDWMVWVKKVFGVIMLSIGLFYVLLALAPSLTGWVAPAALVLGGIYLGFIEKSALKRPGFRAIKWALGAAALVTGLAIVVTTPRGGIAFRAFDEPNFRAALASGRPVLLDFSANWCVPCHELDRSTFTDRRVIDKARPFAAYKVDLTRYDSPEADRWRRQYGIAGVPTVVFLTPGGVEVREARVEGFLPPERFLERLDVARRAGQQAEAR
jgi:thioredoxin:protein disulfide reductase